MITLGLSGGWLICLLISGELIVLSAVKHLNIEYFNLILLLEIIVCSLFNNFKPQLKS